MGGGGGGGGGASFGRGGIGGGVNVGGVIDLGASFSAAAASPAGFGGLTEMICVYALGPLGGGGGAGGASLLPGREKARVASSEGKAEAGEFGIGGLRGVGAGKIGGAGATYDAGCDGAKGSRRGSGNTVAGSAARGSPDGGAVGLGVMLGNEFGRVLGMLLGVVLNGVLEVREGMSELNQPVNPVPAGSFPAIPEVGRGSSG